MPQQQRHHTGYNKLFHLHPREGTAMTSVGITQILLLMSTKLVCFMLHLQYEKKPSERVADGKHVEH